MSRIRGKDTKVELLVQRSLRRQGIYFQKHYRTKSGIVLDIALPRKKKAVQIDGDFWHGRTMNKIRERRGASDFWTKKIKSNIKRDKEQDAGLINDGWEILRIWESDVIRKRTRDNILLEISNFLRNSR